MAAWLQVDWHPTSLSQVSDLQPQHKTDIRPILVSVGLLLAPDDFQIVVDADDASGSTYTISPPHVQFSSRHVFFSLFLRFVRKCTFVAFLRQEPHLSSRYCEGTRFTEEYTLQTSYLGCILQALSFMHIQFSEEWENVVTNWHFSTSNVREAETGGFVLVMGELYIQSTVKWLEACNVIPLIRQS